MTSCQTPLRVRERRKPLDAARIVLQIHRVDWDLVLIREQLLADPNRNGGVLFPDLSEQSHPGANAGREDIARLPHDDHHAVADSGDLVELFADVAPRHLSDVLVSSRPRRALALVLRSSASHGSVHGLRFQPSFRVLPTEDQLEHRRAVLALQFRAEVVDGGRRASEESNAVQFALDFLTDGGVEVVVDVRRVPNTWGIGVLLPKRFDEVRTDDKVVDFALHVASLNWRPAPRVRHSVQGGDGGEPFDGPELLSVFRHLQKDLAKNPGFGRFALEGLSMRLLLSHLEDLHQHQQNLGALWLVGLAGDEEGLLLVQPVGLARLTAPFDYPPTAGKYSLAQQKLPVSIDEVANLVRSLVLQNPGQLEIFDPRLILHGLNRELSTADRDARHAASPAPSSSGASVHARIGIPVTSSSSANFAGVG